MTPERLKALMAEHHLNVKKTADLIGVCTSSIYNWRSGNNQIPARTWDYLVLKLQSVKSTGHMVISGDNWAVRR